MRNPGLAEGPVTWFHGGESGACCGAAPGPAAIFLSDSRPLVAGWGMTGLDGRMEAELRGGGGAERLAMLGRAGLPGKASGTRGAGDDEGRGHAAHQQRGRGAHTIPEQLRTLGCFSAAVPASHTQSWLLGWDQGSQGSKQHWAAEKGATLPHGLHLHPHLSRASVASKEMTVMFPLFIRVTL